MALYLDDIRQQFADFLANNANTRFSMDKALAHVVELAYRQGIEDGVMTMIINEKFKLVDLTSKNSDLTNEQVESVTKNEQVESVTKNEQVESVTRQHHCQGIEGGVIGNTYVESDIDIIDSVKSSKGSHLISFYIDKYKI